MNRVSQWINMAIARHFIARPYSQRGNHRRWLPLLLLITAVTSVCAETITIGKGVGKVWEGMPISGILSGNISAATFQDTSILLVGTSAQSCAISGFTITQIGAYEGIQLARGVILVPQLTVSGFFTRYSGARAYFAGTIGVPRNEMKMQDTNKQMYYRPSQASLWCFHPEGAYNHYLNYFQANSPREIHYSGNWVLFADGSQTSEDEIIIPPVYIASAPSTRLYEQILPASITLRISALACSAVTTTNVNFGNVPRNTEPGTELATYSAPLTVTCTQDAGKSVDANINVQFRAISGQYEGSSTRLALNQGGGYITGEINSGITSSGNCSAAASGLPFDATPVNVGSIAIAEYDKVFNQQITWRLCSGGTSLPTGPVDASAEMLVTYN